MKLEEFLDYINIWQQLSIFSARGYEVVLIIQFNGEMIELPIQRVFKDTISKKIVFCVDERKEG